MKKPVKILWFFLFNFISLTGFSQIITPSIESNETQRQLNERGYGMFIHFGMNTFIEQEWSDGTEPAITYAPTQLDCEQRVKTAKDACFR